jgi:hypothetical protein
MNAKRKIKGKDVISDICSGLTDSQLMDKYGLSPMGLQKVFRKLVDAGALSIQEVYGRNFLREDSVVIDLDDIIFAPDSPAECLIPICDATNPECRGAVCEIGENGLQVTGINATTGEVRSFLIDARDFFAVDELRFQAKCLWSKESSMDQSSLVGWEITGILAEDLENLRELVRRIKVQG